MKEYSIKNGNNNEIYITKIAPYDMQEYFWAIIRNDTKIYKGNKLVKKLESTKQNEIIEELKKLNNKLSQKIDKT